MSWGRPRSTAAAVVAGLALSACGGGGDSETSTQANTCTPVTAPGPKKVKLKKPKETLKPDAAVTATVKTNCGSFTIALDAKRAPKTGGSFAYQVRKGVYDGTLFHRIEPGFVIQGGDPLGNGIGDAGYRIDELPPSDLAYTKGVVAMARSQAEPPGRSGSQFFVVTAADAGLEPTYALLGKLAGGLDVVERIGALGSAGGAPIQPVVIESITLSGAGGAK
jgi:peptidyl-prolyl cis-trans isomerase B (cyclophilin B)